jgi:hypothetical protein
VSSDLDDLFAGLRADVSPIMTRPDRIRRLGAARTRNHRLAAVGGALAFVTILAGTGVALAGPGPVATPLTSSSPSPVQTPPPSAQASPSSPTPTQSPSGSATSSPSQSRNAGANCGRTDLSLQPVQGNGGHGSVGFDVVVTNRSGGPCRMAGDPTLMYTKGDGTLAKIPYTYQAPNQTRPTPFALPAGGRTQFTIVIDNGFSGYDPSTSPECAHPVVYRGIYAVLAGGDRLPLTGLTLNVECDGVRLIPWGPPS